MNKITKITSEQRALIRRNSVHVLPTRPAERGLKEADVKNAMYKPLSMLADCIDEKIDEINGALEDLNDVTPDIAIKATIDSTKGDPSVSVIRTGTNDSPKFELVFSGLKGEDGDVGEGSNPNMLINPNFAIRQRAVAGTVPARTTAYSNYTTSGANAQVGTTVNEINAFYINANVYYAKNVFVMASNSAKGETGTTTISLSYAAQSVTSVTNSKGSVFNYTLLAGGGAVRIQETTSDETYTVTYKTTLETVYFNASDVSTTSNRYTYDRVWSQNATVTNAERGINFTSTKVDGTYKRLMYFGCSYVKGETYTLSMCAKVNDVSGTVSFRPQGRTSKFSSSLGAALTLTKDNVSIGEWRKYSVTFTAPSNQDGASDKSGIEILVDKSIDAFLNIDIAWWKVEVGEQATDYTEPSVAEELPKCQYYFVALGGLDGNINVGFAQAISATQAMGVIPLPCTMRKKATLNFPTGKLPILRNVATDITPTQVTNLANSGACLYVSFIGDFTAGTTYQIRLESTLMYIDTDI